MVVLIFRVANEPRQSARSVLSSAPAEPQRTDAGSQSWKLGSTSATATTSPSSAADALSKFGRMAAAYSGAEDLRVFVEKAKLKPEDGGIAYASLAVRHCSAALGLQTSAGKTWDRTTALDQTAAPQRMAALELYKRRCASFTHEELAAAAEVFQTGANSDPVVKVLIAARGNLDATTRTRLTEEMMRMRDPYSLTSMPLLQSRGGPAYLDGIPYGGVDRREYMHAISLLPCAFGAGCDKSHEGVVLQCVAEGTCAKDLFDLVRHASAETPGSYERIMTIYSRLAQVVASGDSSALVPPRGQTAR